MNKENKMKINTNVIKELKPCTDRYRNWLKHYKDREFSRGQFMGLKHITQEDKMWVAFRLMKKELIQQAAADIADSVLHLYEAEYPGDNRPRAAIEAARTGKDANAAIYAAYAAYAAAYAADAAANAAYAAAYDAATYAYDAATYAYDAATYAYDAAADAYDAAADAYAANASRPAQGKLIRKIVLKYWCAKELNHEQQISQ